MDVNRRGLLLGLGSVLITAPAIVHVASIMPVRSIIVEPDWKHVIGTVKDGVVSEYVNGVLTASHRLTPPFLIVPPGNELVSYRYWRKEFPDGSCVLSNGQMFTAEGPTMELS